MNLEELAVVAISIAIMTIIASQQLKRVTDKKIKGDQIKAIFAQLGLKNFKAEDFNKLTTQGMSNLIAFIVAWKQTESPFASMGLGMGAGAQIDLSKYLPQPLRSQYSARQDETEKETEIKQ